MKEKIINEILYKNNNAKYNYLILKLLKENKLDNLINNITNRKIKLNITTLQKKEYLSEIEHFLMILSNTIYFFKEKFYFLNNNIDYIISTILKDKKNTKYLLSPKYIGDNKNIEYYNYRIKKLIISSYYNNLVQLSKKSLIIKNYLHYININNIKEKENIEILFNNLIKISLCNATLSNNVLLFKNINNYIKDAKLKSKNRNIKKHIENFYITQYEIMINNYYTKKDIIKILLK